jgi:hypothetical protein
MIHDVDVQNATSNVDGYSWPDSNNIGISNDLSSRQLFDYLLTSREDQNAE